MKEQNRNIQEDEFRVIGKPVIENAPKKRPWFAFLSALILIAIALFAIFLLLNQKHQGQSNDLFDDTTSLQSVDTSSPLGHAAQASYAEKIDTVINDIHLYLLIPHNAVPSLVVGTPNATDTTIVLAVQAAGIRADNLEILGSFVLNGDIIARGKSKKGFCAIIDDNIIIGTAENTSFFEEAVDKGGDFFRQYPLVDNGILVESGPKGKSTRRALCSRTGEIIVALSESAESMHDFAQALVDLGVENAIYLVGGQNAYGWCVDLDKEQTVFGSDSKQYKNENYLVWSCLP